MKNSLKFKSGDVVTSPRESGRPPGVFIVSADAPNKIRLSHPFLKGSGLVMERTISELDLTTPDVMGSAERGIHFCLSKQDLLDFSTIQDIKALALYFVAEGRLTPRQKQKLSEVCGQIAQIELDYDFAKAKYLILENKGVLDEFNMNWFSNLEDIFKNERRPTTRSRRAIFNMAGFVMSEMTALTIPRS